jgi:hypothetical protein
MAEPYTLDQLTRTSYSLHEMLAMLTTTDELFPEAEDQRKPRAEVYPQRYYEGEGA